MHVECREWMFDSSTTGLSNLPPLGYRNRRRPHLAGSGTCYLVTLIPWAKFEGDARRVERRCKSVSLLNHLWANIMHHSLCCSTVGARKKWEKDASGGVWISWHLTAFMSDRAVLLGSNLSYGSIVNITLSQVIAFDAWVACTEIFFGNKNIYQNPVAIRKYKRFHMFFAKYVCTLGVSVRELASSLVNF